MRFGIPAIAAVVALALAVASPELFLAAEAKSGRSSSASARRSGGSRGGGRSGGGGGGGRSRGPAPTSRRRAYEEEEEEEEEDFGDFGFPDEEEEEEEADDGYDSDARYDDEEEEPPPRRPSKRSGGRGPPPSRRGPPPPRRPRYEEEDEYDAYDAMEDEYEDRRPSRGGRGSGPPPPRGRAGPPPRRGGPPPRGSRGSGGRSSGGSRRGGSGSGGRVVPYSRGRSRQAQQPGAFTRGLTALRESIPDPTAVKDAAFAAASAAKETTSKLSANVYREVKGLTSSELEQVMLKATQPNDAPVKGKHVERLVGVTYQISGRYDIYDAVLRKLWSKMAEKDWRTKIKALYVLHRFSADGAPDHQAALKARLRELRRTRDPKRKEKYFNSKQLLGGDASPENAKYRAFLARYAHYVLLRAQCFGGMFNEISGDPASAASSGGGGKSSSRRPAPPKKPLTSTSLRPEHLEAAQMILKAGCACALRDGEECENTAFCVERVAADLAGLVGAVATALNRVLKDDGRDGSDPAVVARWCEFYSDELLPQTKGLIKKTSPRLDAYGLFLPSRMGASVSQELLKRGLKGAEAAKEEEEEEGAESEREEEEEEESPAAAEAEQPEEAAPAKKVAEKKEVRKPEPVQEEEEEYDEYEYEEEEYYDDEDA